METILVFLLSAVSGGLLLVLWRLHRRLAAQTARGAVLQETVARFRRALAEAPIPLMLHAEDGEVLSMSRAWSAITGYSADEIRSVRDWVERAYPSEEVDTVWQRIKRLYDLPGPRQEDEVSIRTRDGATRIWQFSSAPQGRLADGRRYVVSTAADVTAQKRAEADLRQRMAFEQVVAEIAATFTKLEDQGVDEAINWALGAAGEIVAADRAYLFRLSADGLYLSNTHEWCGPDIEARLGESQDLAAVEFEHALDLFRRGEIFLVNNIAELPASAAGCRRFQNRKVQSLLNVPILAQGALLGFVGFDSIARPARWSRQDLGLLRTVADLIGTLLVRLDNHHALQDRENKLREAQHLAHLGHWEWDFAGGRMFWSAEVAALFGLPAQDTLVPLTQFSDALHPDDADAAKAQLREFLAADQEQCRAEFRILDHGSGAVHHINAIVQAVRDARGKVQRLRGTAQDISAHKLFETQLKQARDAAEAASRAKSAFLANMSHELRTPLNAVLGFAQVLLKDPDLSVEQKQKIATIRHSGEYLLTLINDVLDLAKIEAHHLELLPMPTNLRALFDNLAGIFHPRAEQKGLYFRYEISRDLPFLVEVDDKRLRQIAVNLLGNAIKFTEHGGVELSVTYCQSELHIAVADSGVGIESAQLDNIFQPFHQAGSLKYNSQGTGLGLAISYNLVELMNGSLEVDSTLGRGSCFRVKLPLSVEAGLTYTPAPRQISGYQRTDGKTTPLHALIVDDIKENRDALRWLLEDAGFSVSEAVDGESALSLLLSVRPDVILMDLVMPGLDGLETTRQIRTRRKLAEVPVIAVSARAYEEDQARSYAAGCQAHINKPWREDELWQVLGELLALEWCYTHTEEYGPAKNPELDTEFLRKHREPLLGLVNAGDIMGVLGYLDDIAADAPSAALSRIRELADNFDLKAVKALLT